MSAHDIKTLELIESGMPGASPDQVRQATEEFWLFFDALWAIADRVVAEKEALGAVRDRLD